MSAWVNPRTGGGSSSVLAQPSSGSGHYQPPVVTADEQGSAPAAPDTNVGVANVDITHPTVGGALGGVEAGLDGLKKWLFGTNEVSQPDAQGTARHGGILGDIPVVGDIGRGVTNVIGDVSQTAGNILEDADLFERVSLGGAQAVLQKQKFDAIDQNRDEDGKSFLDEPIPTDKLESVLGRHDQEGIVAKAGMTWREAIEMEQHGGLFGTDIASKSSHLMGEAVKAFDEAQAFGQYGGKPHLLNPLTDHPAGSLMGFLQQIADVFNWSSQLSERQGAAKVNRLQQIANVEEGRAQWAEGWGRGAQENSVIEKLAYRKVKAGEWTEDEGNDFLARFGAGWSHDPGVNVLGEFFLDPVNLLSFGAGFLVKAGARGAALLGTIDRAASLVNDANKALEGAKIAGTAEDIARAEAVLNEAVGKLKALDKYAATKMPSRLNVIARAMEGSEGMQDFFKAAGKVYQGMQGTTIGRALKLTRYLIDPLHAIDLKLPGNTKMVNLLSDAVDKTMVDVLNPVEHLSLLDDMAKIDPTGALGDAFQKAFSVGAKNRARELLITAYVRAQIAADGGVSLMQDVMDGRRLIPDDIIARVAADTREAELMRMLREDTTRNILRAKRMSEAEVDDLARHMETVFHGQSAAEWKAAILKMSKEKQSMLEFARYGHVNSALLDAIKNSGTHPSAGLVFNSRTINDMVLLSRNTLDRVLADDLLAKISKAKGLEAKLKLIRDAQERWPSTRFVSIDEANPGKSVEQFVEWLTDRREKLPMLVKNDELAQMSDEMQGLGASLADSGYKLGFAPADEFKFGLERVNAEGGKWGVVEAPFVGHVGAGESGKAYMPARHLNMNINGYPLATPIRGAVKAVDYMAATARILKQQVSGAQIAAMAQKRFVSEESRGRFAAHGLTEAVAQSWWERIQEFSRAHKGYSGPRGFEAESLYNELARSRLIPQPMLNGSMQIGAYDVMRMVMEAYDGDMRFIGLTQKLSARAKAWLFKTTGSNFAGQVSEHLWPTLKFFRNPVFQLQEKIEPIAWGVTRGYDVAGKPILSEADKATERLLQIMQDNSIIRQSDLDQAEYNIINQMGGEYDRIAQQAGSSANRLVRAFAQIMEVQGVKRVNLLRTFRQGLGKEMRAAWEKARPGQWDEMKEFANVNAGRLLDDDEFALHVLGENLDSYEGLILKHADKATGKILGTVDPSNVLKPFEWHQPTTIGEMRKLDLDHVASSFGVIGDDGKTITDVAGLRRYIAADNKRLREVTEYLNRRQVHPDQIARIENALTFSWTGFWRTVEKTFSLTRQERMAFEDMFANAAKMRDMDPVDFLSQLFDPSIAKGEKGVIGELAKAQKLRSRLAGTAGESTREDLIRQISGVFSAYLDPSAKRALLLEFQPELRELLKAGKIGGETEAEVVRRLWTGEMDDALAGRIAGYVDGKLGTGAHEVVDVTTNGSKAALKGARDYLAKRGVKPQDEYRIYELDEELAQRSSKAYDALPEVPFERTARIPRISQVDKADVDIKPRPEGVDERTYSIYRDYAVDNRNMWDHMTAPKEKGGMGLKVSIVGDDMPYASVADLQDDIAKGKLRVYGGESDHALLTNEQVVQSRAAHMVFGHAAEGHEFDQIGAHNAVAAHSQMYSPTGRSAFITEQHGAGSYMDYHGIPMEMSPVQSVKIDPKRPADSFEEAFTPKQIDPDFPVDTEVEARYMVTLPSGVVHRVDYSHPTRVGAGIRALPLEQQTAILQQLSDFHARFPTAQVWHINAPADFHLPVTSGGLGFDQGTRAAFIPGSNDELVILISPKAVGEGSEAFWQRVFDDNAVKRLRGDMPTRQPGVEVPRKTVMGRPWTLSSTLAGDLWHELGHGISHFLGGPNAKGRFGNFVRDYLANLPARRHLSEYGFENEHEAIAELFNLAINPEYDLDTLKSLYLQGETNIGIHPQVAALAEELRRVFIEMDVYKPGEGVPRMPQKLGILPQDILDEFGEKFVGQGKHLETNPDVARTAQHFADFSQRVIANGLMKGSDLSGEAEKLLTDLRGTPVDQAVPYNLTEGLLQRRMFESMASKWSDANRLTYFAQERSFLERSINHPMFGLYPASYMWGKVMPELIRFFAQKPFGIRTGALAYSTMDMQARVALEREFNPEFDAMIENLGHSQAMGVTSYFLPGVPWDLSASMPLYVRAAAKQGLQIGRDVETGAQPGEPDIVSPFMQQLGRLNPLEFQLPWIKAGAEELLGSPNARKETVPATQGAELGDPLARAMQELREALSR